MTEKIIELLKERLEYAKTQLELEKSNFVMKSYWTGVRTELQGLIFIITIDYLNQKTKVLLNEVNEEPNK